MPARLPTKIQVGLEEDEAETIISILNFCSTSCPISEMNEHVKIDHRMIQKILQKMLESIPLNEQKPDDLSKAVKLDH
jgi:predicted transcriptional regulator